MPGSFIKNDLPTFLNTGEFATDASYTPAGGAASDIDIIFDDEYVVVVDNVESSGPAAWCRTSDLVSLTHSAMLSISATSYLVRGIQPDGTGITLLLLTREA